MKKAAAHEDPLLKQHNYVTSAGRSVASTKLDGEAPWAPGASSKLSVVQH